MRDLTEKCERANNAATLASIEFAYAHGLGKLRAKKRAALSKEQHDLLREVSFPSETCQRLVCSHTIPGDQVA